MYSHFPAEHTVVGGSRGCGCGVREQVCSRGAPKVPGSTTCCKGTQVLRGGVSAGYEPTRSRTHSRGSVSCANGLVKFSNCFIAFGCSEAQFRRDTVRYESLQEDTATSFRRPVKMWRFESHFARFASVFFEHAPHWSDLLRSQR
jgi:hypothetical protein